MIFGKHSFIHTHMIWKKRNEKKKKLKKIKNKKKLKKQFNYSPKVDKKTKKNIKAKFKIFLEIRNCQAKNVKNICWHVDVCPFKFLVCLSFKKNIHMSNGTCNSYGIHKFS